MTREEAIEIIKNLKEYMRILDKTSVSKFLEDNYIALEMAIKALVQEPCSDVVSRQAVETLVDELARAISDERCCISRGRSTATIMQDILDLPSVNPQEPKTGHWIKSSIGGAKICSICQAHMGLSSFKFCPNCGARMESEE